MNLIKLLLLPIISILLVGIGRPNDKFDFRIRTITAGVTLHNLSDTTSINKAIIFLKKARQVYLDNGYEVQTIRISTQNLHGIISGKPTKKVIEQLEKIDKILLKNNVVLAIGQLIEGDQYDSELANWTIQLVNSTSNISFSIPISSEQNGIHNKSIKTAAEICKALSENSEGGEANFRFTASTSVQEGTPFFPAAFHNGENSFAIGLEYPNVITRIFKESNFENAEVNLKNELEIIMKPIEQLANKIETSDWKYDGIDTSPAPGLDASIGEAIETLTKKPFGSSTTLSTCSIITRTIKNLDVRSCGYSGLMLPVIEDKVLAKRASEEYYTVKDLLLFSSVSGTRLDVIPISGNISQETIEGVYQDVAALSIRYFNKALSARLFPIPGKVAGQVVEFDNPYLTSSRVMELK